MNSKQLSKRLGRVADLIQEFGPQPIRLADIGSDHAYLPCHLGLLNGIDFAIAGEVVEGPYRSALTEVTTQGLVSKIHVRKGDGLAVIEEKDMISTISICGMGGALISDILTDGLDKIEQGSRLILQPNMASHRIREFCHAYKFQILHEEVIEENGKYYEILVVEASGNSPIVYNEVEMLLGRHNIMQPSQAFINKWQEEEAIQTQVLKKVIAAKGPQDPAVLEIQNKINRIREGIGRNDNL